MVKVISHIITLFLISQICFGQHTAGDRVVVFGTSEVENNFFVYDPPFQAKAIYSDTTEAINQYPEQLMSSMLSATSQAWENYNAFDGQGGEKNQRHYDGIRTMDKDQNYLELICKYEFLYEETPTAFIKFNFVFENEEKQAGFRLMKKQNNRWYFFDIPNFISIPYMLFWYKADIMQALLLGEPTGNAQTDELIQQTRDENGALDFEKLVEQFQQMERMGKSTDKFRHFIDPVAFNYY